MLVLEYTIQLVHNVYFYLSRYMVEFINLEINASQYFDSVTWILRYWWVASIVRCSHKPRFTGNQLSMSCEIHKSLASVDRCANAF